MGWHKGLTEWTEGNTAYLSVVFSWDMQKAYQRAVWYRQLGYKVRAGGPAVILNPEVLADVAEIGGEVNALPRHNPDATFTSRGCVNRCPFCAVPKIEGDLIELDNWEVKPIICDNNLLACSKKHFDDVIDKLKQLKGVDFNQGLDARLLTKYHAQRFTELKTAMIRLAWDSTKLEAQFMKAFQLLMDAGITPKHIRVYVLIGFNDTPEDALYRLQTIKGLGALPNPARYQLLNATHKNAYVDKHWTERQLKDFMRYWYRSNWLEHVPFEEYCGYKPTAVY